MTWLVLYSVMNRNGDVMVSGFVMGSMKHSMLLNKDKFNCCDGCDSITE